MIRTIAFFLVLDLSFALKIEPVRWLENKTLECFGAATSYNFEHWVTPKEDIVTRSIEGEYIVDRSSGALTILAAEGKDTGVYRCIYSALDGSYFLKTVQIDVWDYTDVINKALDWEANLVRGIIIAVICVVICVGYWLLYEWQWVAPSDFGTDAIYEKHALRTEVIEMKPSTYENAAFEIDTSQNDTAVLDTIDTNGVASVQNGVTSRKNSGRSQESSGQATTGEDSD